MGIIAKHDKYVNNPFFSTLVNSKYVLQHRTALFEYQSTHTVTTPREAGPLPLDTPRATPLRPHEHSETSTLPSLLPPSGTTLSIPPQTTATIMPTISSAMVIVTIPPPGSELATPVLPPHNQGTTRHTFLPIAGIIGIAVGCIFTLIICLFLLVLRFRAPRRRKIPIPSLPKFEDNDLEKETLSQDSPLFGPNERFSQRPGLNPTWSWVTFPLNKAETRGTDDSQMKGSSVPDQQSFHPHQLPQYTAVTHSRPNSLSQSSNRPDDHPSHPSLQQLQAAITRVTNKMSTVSLEYGSSGLKNQDTVFTGDDETKWRSKSLRKSGRISIYEDRRGVSHASIGLAYDGADVASPVPALDFMPLDSPELSDDSNATRAESRTRIQTPYYANAYPRISSAMPATYGVATRVKLGEMKGGASGQPKSESQRAKETQALTRAIGLASPLQVEGLTLSPQPTLYPDDSLSIVESKQLLKQRVQKARGSIFFDDDRYFHQVSDDGRHQYVVATPTRNIVTVASGSLVSAEDIKALASNSGLGMEVAVPGKKGLRDGNRPPRVPSPPPLPSLAQMALEHGDPEGYADYRSPTYSIYNLYGMERKSTVRDGRPQP